MTAQRASWVLALVPLAACRALGAADAWSFPVTRECVRALDEYQPGPPDDSKHWTCPQGAEGLWFFAVLLGAPLLIDLVILPVTAAHDLART